jgi:uncharacterized protein
MNAWVPVSETERYRSIDALRGLSLFGVLLVNLLDFFRVSLFEHILNFHTDPGWTNRVVDVMVATLLEFKAFDLFSFTFGVGVAIQTERAMLRGIHASGFLTRRFLVLLVFGLCHLILISNVDILTMYAVCGLILIPVRRLPASALAVLGVIALLSIFPTRWSLPSNDVIRLHITEATHVYREGTFFEILAFRWRETLLYIGPLLLMSLQKTLGLMLLGMAVWRTGLVQEPGRHRGLLRTVLTCTGAVGGISTALLVLGESSGGSAPVPAFLTAGSSHLLLATAYAAGVFLWWSYPRSPKLANYFAAAGQMALTNYLIQSLILSYLFYGYGLGLFGRLDSGPAAMIGIAIYAAQLVFSSAWLRSYRFGPVEWLWRSLTYGSWQPLRTSIYARDTC